MTDLLNIAKECGGEFSMLLLPSGNTRYIELTEEQLHATVEKVCGPLVEALEFYANKRNWSKDSQEYGSEMSDYNVMWKDVYEFNQATRYAGFTAIDCLDKFRKLMGQDK